MSDAQPLPLFVCYAREDQPHLEALDKHLATLKRQGRITVWNDQQLLPSAEWEPELLEHLRQARIVLLLISPDFMASAFIHDVELKLLMERHVKGEVRLVPVLVRPTDLEGHPLTRFQGLPRGLLPVTLHSSADLGWLEVVKGLRALLDVLSPPLETPRPAPAPSLPRIQAPDSGMASDSSMATVSGIAPSPPEPQVPRGPDFSRLPSLSDSRSELPPFDPRGSAGLFVGVSRFFDASGAASSEFLTIPFAVDDAIDLAAHFAFELKLLPAQKVYLLLSGEPQKQQTREALSRLRAEGATLGRATFTQVLDAIAAVAREARPEGLLLISAATHGLTADGERLLCEDSRRERLALSSVAWTYLEQTVTRSACPRRLLLLDACREHVTAHRSGGVGEATRLADAIQAVQGLAVLCGAPPGGYCYDDLQAQNGAFTALLLEGLRQGAPANGEGLVTLKSLAMWVDQALQGWLKEQNRGSSAGLGISMRLEPVGIGELPLVVRAGAGSPSQPAARSTTSVPAAPSPAEDLEPKNGSAAHRRSPAASDDPQPTLTPQATGPTPARTPAPATTPALQMPQAVARFPEVRTAEAPSYEPPSYEPPPGRPAGGTSDIALGLLAGLLLAAALALGWWWTHLPLPHPRGDGRSTAGEPLHSGKVP